MRGFSAPPEGIGGRAVGVAASQEVPTGRGCVSALAGALRGWYAFLLAAFEGQGRGGLLNNRRWGCLPREWNFPMPRIGRDHKPGSPGRHWLLRVIVLGTVVLLLQGCSLFGFFGEEEAAEAEEPKDPFAEGMLRAIAHLAPPNSTPQFLSEIAEQLGWEEDVARNKLLRFAALSEQFDEKVTPFLLGLFFKKGFSVLPTVGEGHQFSRDSVVRGAVEGGRFLVTTRGPVRIIFLQPIDNVQIIYPKDGTQPQIFSINAEGVVALRRSRLEQYLR